MALDSSLLLVWGSTAGYGGLHSLLASNRCKRLCSFWPAHRYRLIYSLTSGLLLLLWLLWLRTLPDAPLYHFDALLRWSLHLVQLGGVLLLIAAAREVDLSLFIGLRPFPPAGEAFVERGIYRYLRHPMYCGAALILLANPVQTVVGLHFALAVTLYFAIGARLEERRMVLYHPEYADYRQRVWSGI